MTDLIAVQRIAGWEKLKALVLDSVSSPITKRVYNMALEEFMGYSVSSSVSQLCRRLGLPEGASLQTLRHTHGSFLLADGVDLVTVSERLGHSSVRVTADIYSHALRGRDQEGARRWDRFRRLSAGSREEPDALN